MPLRSGGIFPRAKMATLLVARAPASIVFTRRTTDSIELAVLKPLGVALEYPCRIRSVMRPWEALSVCLSAEPWVGEVLIVSAYFDSHVERRDGRQNFPQSEVLE